MTFSKNVNDLKQLFISVPNTLVLTINRFEIDMKDNRTEKNCTEIKADRTINLELCTDILHNVRYQLKGVVCHHGRSVHSGH